MIRVENMITGEVTFHSNDGLEELLIAIPDHCVYEEI